MKEAIRSFALLAGVMAFSAIAGDDAELYFIAPADGADVQGPVAVVFGLRGMGVAPAGIERPGTGHHHLIIDAPLPPTGKPVPADGNHLHFGGGQTETVLDLPPGRHTLQLLLGDHLHMPLNPAVISKQITITVLPDGE